MMLSFEICKYIKNSNMEILFSEILWNTVLIHVTFDKMGIKYPMFIFLYWMSITFKHLIKSHQV